MKKRATVPAPEFPVAPFENYDAFALRALSAGTATAEEQKRALRWIVNGAAMLTSQSFVPGSADVTAFNEGRRNVAKQITHLIVCDLEPAPPAAGKN